MAQQNYNTNAGAVRAGLRDLNDRTDLPYDELKSGDRLDGRTVLLTGGTSGLGLATAKEMAARGARLLIVARREAHEELAEIRSAGASSGNPSQLGKFQILQADMSDFASIRALVARLVRDGETVDVVVSNAAVVPSSARRTGDGFEEMLQVNALAPALLLTELLAAGVVPNNTYAGNGTSESSRADRPLPRIVVVASEAHQSAPELKLNHLENLESYNMAESTPRYGWTKLLLLTFVRELGRRLSVDGVDVSVHALCPGPIASNIAREVPAVVRPFSRLFFRIFFQSPAVAARPVVYLAASERIEGQTGLYQFLMRQRSPSAVADAPENGEAVWAAFDDILNRTDRRTAS